jgi:hypothetical protein
MRRQLVLLGKLPAAIRALKKKFRALTKKIPYTEKKFLH